MDVPLNTLALKAVYSTYIFAQNNVFTVYMGSSTKYIMNNLMTRYGHIMSAHTEEKKTFLQEPLYTLANKSQTIYLSVKVINDGVRYASETNTPFLSEQVIQMAYHAVSSARTYTYACKDWRRNPIVEKV